MNDPKSILTAARLLLLGYAVAVAFRGWWSFKARVPRVVRARYPERVTYMSQLPFTEAWRTAVAPEDLRVFLKARLRGHVFTASLIVFVTYMPVLYAYLQMTAELLRCHLEIIR